jgi:hypothetical protein
MIERDDDKNIYVLEKDWKAFHKNDTCGGPEQIDIKGKKAVEGIFSSISDLKDDQCMTRRIKGYNKSGQSTVESEGYLPFGGEAEFRQTARYHKNLLRFTQDINFRKGTTVDRHFSVGSMKLPGLFNRFTIVPPAQHQTEGGDVHVREIPKWQGKDIMVGHWHRPPLSLIFHRKDGIDLEIGTGFDLWRWEQNLGYYPESGSYKVMLTEEGLELIREPLACCEEYEPEQRNYRFTWYFAWQDRKKKNKLPDHDTHYVPFKNAGKEVDFERLKRELTEREKGDKPTYLNLNIIRGLAWSDKEASVPSSQAYCCGLAADEICWEAGFVVRRLKKIMRRLSEIEGIEGIVLEGVDPSICYNPSHVDRKNVMGMVHWDIGSVFDFFSWLENHVKGRFPIFLQPNEESLDLPSINGFFSC